MSNPEDRNMTGAIPRGIEVLVKKASVDTEFRADLINRRAEVAADIGLDLDPAEIAMINTIPEDHLEAIIDRTEVKPESRRVFLGKVASLMLAALGATVVGCAPEEPGVDGIRPDRPESDSDSTEVPEPQLDGDADPHPVSRGISPDRPQSDTSDVQHGTKGIRPDRPKNGG